METVFSTLRPATLLLCQTHTKCLSKSGEKEALPFLSFISMFFLSPPQHPSSHPSFLATFFTSLILLLSFALHSLLCFQIKRTQVFILRLTLFVAKLDIIQVTEGGAVRRLLDLFLDGAVLTGCCLTQFIYLTEQ